MKRVLIASSLVVLTLTGCASSQSGGSYSRGQTRGEMTVRLGVVEGVRNVSIEGAQSGIGTVAGAAVGGIAGSNVGQGKGSTVGSILGAVAGGLAGQMIEEHSTKKEGVEITVKLEGGKLIAITQEADEKFVVGERVRVLTGGGVTRVSR